MRILGVWDGHDSGAVLLVDGRLVAAVNEERLSRRKLEIRFPERSIHTCLSMAGLTPADIQMIAISTTDIAKALGRWIPSTKETYYAVRRRRTHPGIGANLKRRAKYWLTEWKPNRASKWLSEMVLKRELHRLRLNGADLRFVDHHRAHAAAAAFASRMDPCVVVTIDGVGDGLSSSVSIFRDRRLVSVATTPARHSLGVFFEHVTHLLNMRELEDEGKVMALADYASPISDADNPLLSLITVSNGRFRTDTSGARLLNRLKRIHWLCPNEQFAYMAQRVIERRTVELVRDAIKLTGLRRVALAGGVLSNVKANRQIRLMPEVEDLYVFPHMGDGGLALGAAVAVADGKEQIDLNLSDLGLGPEYPAQCLAAALEAHQLRAVKCDDVPERVADLLARDAIVMWFQGRMEYGPRSLGYRSVVARPDSRAVRDRLNLVLKRRVWYQPFCPSLLESDAARIFSDWAPPCTNTQMTMAYLVSPAYREALAGVIGVDGSCRPQIVSDSTTGCFAQLLHAVRRRLKLGVVLNTSYNIHGEPLVCSPEDAVQVFSRSGADALVLGPYLVLAESARPK